jgi:hypothetical protein
MTAQEIRAMDIRLIQRFIDSGDITWKQVEEAWAQDPNRYSTVEVSVSSIPQPAMPRPNPTKRGTVKPGKIRFPVAVRTPRILLENAQ